MKNLFLDKNLQIRSGWKIAIVFITFFISTNLLAEIIVDIYSICETIYNNLYNSHLEYNIRNSINNISSPFGFICSILQCLCMIFSIFLFLNKFDKKHIIKIGMIHIKKGCNDLIIGLLLGSLSLIIVFSILLATQNVALITPLYKPNFNFKLLLELIVFILVGINEEMFSRGYCMTVLKQISNKYIISAISAIIFATMHSLNPSINLLSYINIFLFGMLTSYMFIKSGNLWLSIGYHIAWNYFEGSVFGFLVSGQLASSIYSIKLPVNNFINGGNFGPEGGIVVTFIILLCLIYLWKFYKPSYIEAENKGSLSA